MTAARRRYGLVVDPATSARLARVPQRDTRAELRTRSIAYALGLRYRTRNKDLPGSPDLANRKRRWAVFVHGCYWHSHADCSRATVPKRNRTFWEAKFAGNRARDAQSIAALKERGYYVLVVWECELATPAVVRRHLARLLHR